MVPPVTTPSLRVLMISDVSPARPEGGGERMLWEQASRLAARGHEVRVLSRAHTAGADDQYVSVPGHHNTWNPWAYGSSSSMKIVLNPVTFAHPSMEGTMAFFPPTVVSSSTLPVKRLPI